MTFIQKDTSTTWVLCDCCHKIETVVDADETPDGWRQIHLPGFVGHFHACCPDCETSLLLRLASTEAES